MELNQIAGFEPYSNMEIASEIERNFIDVTAKDCHKVLPKNVFIHQAIENSENDYELIANIDHKTQDFFFDHEIDHIPGMALAYIIRQAVLVVCHRFLRIPYEFKFIMDDLSARYFNRAELMTPMTVKCSVQNARTIKNKISKGELKASVFQNGVLLVEGVINFRVMRPEVYKRLGAFTHLKAGG